MSGKNNGIFSEQFSPSLDFAKELTSSMVSHQVTPSVDSVRKFTHSPVSHHLLSHTQMDCQVNKSDSLQLLPPFLLGDSSTSNLSQPCYGAQHHYGFWPAVTQCKHNHNVSLWITNTTILNTQK